MTSPKWNRIDALSPQERKELELLTSKTRGFTLYGHRARAAVMLPLALATSVSQYAEQQEISVGQAIIDLLQRGERDQEGI